MTGMLPITEILDDCETDARRAQWLLSVPSFVFYRDQCAIRRVLRVAGFLKGVELLDAELALMLSTRDVNGEPPAIASATVSAMRSFMRTLVRKGGLV